MFINGKKLIFHGRNITLESGTYTLLGILIGGLLTWAIQYYFRREERKWEEKNDKKKTAIEALEILHEIFELFGTFPQTSEDDAYFKKINERIRMSRVKLKLLWGFDNSKIFESFENANHALKNFPGMKKGERFKVTKESRESIKKFENLLINNLDSNLKLSKIEIPKKISPTIRHHLSRCNIILGSLFPGLEGIVRRIKYRYHPCEDEPCTCGSGKKYKKCCRR